MLTFKTFTFLFIGIYIAIQLFSIALQFSGAKIITVYKGNYPDSDAYISGYKTENGSIKKFDVRVKPKDVWDRLLLTHEDDNLLSDLFKIAASVAFAFYIYNLSYDNIFSKKSFNLFWLTLCFCVFNYCAYYWGTSYTRDFYSDLYKAHGGDIYVGHDFQSGPKFGVMIQGGWPYYVIIMILLNFYKVFNRRHEGKPDEDW